MIIIGILAAIAIPIFLQQRTKAQDAACLSDARNGAAAATGFAADNNGSYDGMTTEDLTEDYGWTLSPSVSDQAVASADASSFTITATSARPPRAPGMVPPI